MRGLELPGVGGLALSREGFGKGLGCLVAQNHQNYASMTLIAFSFWHCVVWAGHFESKVSGGLGSRGPHGIRPVTKVVLKIRILKSQETIES